MVETQDSAKSQYCAGLVHFLPSLQRSHYWNCSQFWSHTLWRGKVTTALCLLHHDVTIRVSYLLLRVWLHIHHIGIDNPDRKPWHYFPANIDFKQYQFYVIVSVKTMCILLQFSSNIERSFKPIRLIDKEISANICGSALDVWTQSRHSSQQSIVGIQFIVTEQSIPQMMFWLVVG